MKNTISELNNRRNQKQATRSKGSNQQAGGQGRKTPRRAGKGKKTEKEQTGLNGNAGQHEM